MRNRHTPWYAKTMLGLVLTYIVSPIDFILVIGLLDEVILVPIALAIIFKLIPDSVRYDASLNQIDDVDKKRFVITGILLVIIIWIVFSFLLYSSFY